MRSMFTSVLISTFVVIAPAPVLADQGFVTIQEDIFGELRFQPDLLNVYDERGISWGEVDDFYNAIEDAETSNVEYACYEVVRFPQQYLQISVEFCDEYLAVYRELEERQENRN